MSKTTLSASGKGPRPRDPYMRILWAAKRGQGAYLSADECWKMHLDSAIESRAAYVSEQEGEP